MDRFETCIHRVLVHEGGFANHPKDPGGATNMGITQRTYDAWREKQQRGREDVRDIGNDEVEAIYRAQYWDAVRADELPRGVDYAVFDYAVNSGPGRAVRELQRILGVGVDGIIGAKTLAALRLWNDADLIEEYCGERLAFLKRLKTWPTFGRGWARRVDGVLSAAISDATGQPIATRPEKAPGKAEAQDVGSGAVLGDMLTDGKTLSTIGGMLGSLGAMASGSGPIQWAVAAILVAGALFALWKMTRSRAVEA